MHSEIWKDETSAAATIGKRDHTDTTTTTIYVHCIEIGGTFSYVHHCSEFVSLTECTVLVDHESAIRRANKF
jgi:hypothetical protein